MKKVMEAIRVHDQNHVLTRHTFHHSGIAESSQVRRRLVKRRIAARYKVVSKLDENWLQHG